MFFRVLAAIVTADAFDRQMRAQQHRALVAEEARRQAAAPAAATAASEVAPPRAAHSESWDSSAPERPV
jgi:hypothetical protein